MYFTECARLAEQHPDLADVVERVDKQLGRMETVEVLRIGDLASFLGADPNQIGSVLDLLAREGLLQSEEMIECPHCDMAALRSDYDQGCDEDGEYACSSCGRLLYDDTIETITTYRSGRRWKRSQGTKRDLGGSDPGCGDPVLPAASDGIPDPEGWYSASRLADLYHVRANPLRKRLDRYRDRNDKGWKQTEDRRLRGARFLYQPKFVMHIIESLLATSKRPPK